jgi:hypothetical protein
MEVQMHRRREDRRRPHERLGGRLGVLVQALQGFLCLEIGAPVVEVESGVKPRFERRMHRARD